MSEQCLKIVKNVDQCLPKTKVAPRDVQFTVIGEGRNRKILTFKKQKSEDLEISLF